MNAVEIEQDRKTQHVHRSGGVHFAGRRGQHEIGVETAGDGGIEHRAEFPPCLGVSGLPARQQAKAGVAGADIIDGDAEARMLQGGDRPAKLLHVGDRMFEMEPPVQRLLQEAEE